MFFWPCALNERAPSKLALSSASGVKAGGQQLLRSGGRRRLGRRLSGRRARVGRLLCSRRRVIGCLVARVCDREDRRSEERDPEEGEEEGAGERHCLAYRQASASCLDLGVCTRRGLDNRSAHDVDGAAPPRSRARRLRAPWRTSTSSPSTRRAPRSSAQRANGVWARCRRRGRRPRSRRPAAGRRASRGHEGRPRWRSRAARRGRVAPRRLTPSSAASSAARSGVRFQTVTSTPAWRSAHTAARAAPPAPSTSAVAGTARPSASRRPPASVLSPAIRPSSPKVSVFTAPIAPAASLSSSARSCAASLCGIVTLAPR